jgi:SPP1 family predicted phage head-tail adaptor
MTRPVHTGQLRRRCVLEAPLDTSDDVGGMVRSYYVLANLWASIHPRRVDDTFIAARQETAVTHDIALRWRSDDTPQMRLRLGARLFLIHGARDVDEQRKFLTLQAEEIRS